MVKVVPVLVCVMSVECCVAVFKIVDSSVVVKIGIVDPYGVDVLSGDLSVVVTSLAVVSG